METQYICKNCAFYGSPQSKQGICKKFPYVDIKKSPDDFCGLHSQYAIDKYLLPFAASSTNKMVTQGYGLAPPSP